MDHKMKLLALINWIAMNDPSKRELACMLANTAGLIARQDIEDEGEDPLDRERVTETLREHMEAGFDRRIDLVPISSARTPAGTDVWGQHFSLT